MKIAFYEFSGWDFTPLSPTTQPMGGTQSAVCYLACQIADNGHEVTLINSISKPGIYAGVECPGFAAGASSQYLNSFDTVVVVNYTAGRMLRALGVTTRLLLWSGHATDQKAIIALNDPEERKSWDGFVLVSKWQAQTYAATFGIDPGCIMILGNAMAPSFEAVKRTKDQFTRHTDGPILAYTSTPFRGLDVLLLAFPTIRRAFPTCQLRVYSGMGIYNKSPQQDKYSGLYELCRVLPGVEYIGPVSQTSLASALVEADILAYPSTFAETSCIAVMEAMAAGCTICTSRLGALPETCANFGHLIDPVHPPALHAGAFADLIITSTLAARQAPETAELRLIEQVSYARTYYTWRARARLWEKALA